MQPPLICLTGIDGCGKSTQVRFLSERLQEHGWPTQTVWCAGQPYVSRPLVRIAKRLLDAPRKRPDRRFEAKDPSKRSTEQEFADYVRASNRLFKRYWILRRGWTDLSLFEHAFEARMLVLPHVRRGSAVVADRYMLKSVVNLAVLLDLPLSEVTKLLRHPAFWFAPRPTLYFLLDVPAEVGFERKHDMPSIEYVERRVPVYRELARAAHMPVVDATATPEVVHERIWEIVSATLASRQMLPGPYSDAALSV